MTRIRRLGFASGVDMVNESNWSRNGDTTAQKPLNWRSNLTWQHDVDKELGRDLAFYQAFDERLAAYQTVRKPMSLQQRVDRFGNQFSVVPQPGAPPLRHQQGVGPIIEHVVAENHRIRDRSRSRNSSIWKQGDNEDPRQGSTGWGSSARSSSWRQGDW